LRLLDADQVFQCHHIDQLAFHINRRTALPEFIEREHIAKNGHDVNAKPFHIGPVASEMERMTAHQKFRAQGRLRNRNGNGLGQKLSEPDAVRGQDYPG
jgi:hypothetical protein